MNLPKAIAPHTRRGLLAASLLLCSAAWSAPTTAPAQTTSVDAQIQARYEKERAACLSGQSAEASSACLKEAEAAKSAARKGQLETDERAADNNARQRCKTLPDPERQECEARMHGAGTVSGSVAGGGILRELVTTVPAASASGATR